MKNRERAPRDYEVLGVRRYAFTSTAQKAYRMKELHGGDRAVLANALASMKHRERQRSGILMFVYTFCNTIVFTGRGILEPEKAFVCGVFAALFGVASLLLILEIVLRALWHRRRRC